MKTRWRFTLIELLSVIAVISVLTSILLPALSKARSRVKELKCTSNMKAVTMGTVSYAQDNSGWGPYDPNGSNYLFNSRSLTAFPDYIGVSAKYENSEPERRQAPPITICPEGGRDGTTNLSWNLTATPMPNTSYGYRGVNTTTAPLENLFRIHNPSMRFLLADTLKSIFFTWTQTDFAYRHSNKTNISFVDGHVSRTSIVAIPLAWDRGTDTKSFYKDNR